MRTTPMLVCLLTLAGAGHAQVEPIDVEVRLLRGEQELAPVRVLSPVREGRVYGSRRVAIDGGSLAATDRATGEECWRVDVTAGNATRLLAAHEGVLHVQGWQVTRNEYGAVMQQVADSGLVQRVHVDTGALREPLDLGVGTTDELDLVVEGLAFGPDWMAAIVSQVKLAEHAWENERRGEELVVVDTTTGAVRCREQLEQAADAGLPSTTGGALLLSAGGPAQVAGGVTRIQEFHGDVLLVLRDGTMLCVDPSNATPRWRLERVWEYMRGFIGPSVWQHYLSRAGADPLMAEWEDAQPGAAGGDPDEDTPPGDEVEQAEPGAPAGSDPPVSVAPAATLIGGPVVFDGSDHGARLFAAVAEGSSYVATCRIYEIDSHGTPVAVLPMPRVVLGSEWRVVDDGVLWMCQNGATALIAPSDQAAAALGMGPFDSTDCIGRLALYVEPETPREPGIAPWLATGPAARAHAFGHGGMYSIAAGGSIANRGDGVYRFPIRFRELTSAKTRELVLVVPFTGTVELPSTNYSRRGDSTTTRTPIGLGLTRLEVLDGKLEVTIAGESRAATYVFGLD